MTQRVCSDADKTFENGVGCVPTTPRLLATPINRVSAIIGTSATALDRAQSSLQAQLTASFTAADTRVQKSVVLCAQLGWLAMVEIITTTPALQGRVGDTEEPRALRAALATQRREWHRDGHALYPPYRSWVAHSRVVHRQHQALLEV